MEKAPLQQHYLLTPHFPQHLNHNRLRVDKKERFYKEVRPLPPHLFTKGHQEPHANKPSGRAKSSDCVPPGLPPVKLTKAQLQASKANFQLNDLQHDIIVGTLLGDASIPSRNGRPDFVLKFEQKESAAGYIRCLHRDLKPYSGAEPRYRFLNPEKTRRSIGFKTYSHKDFIYFENLFYTRNSDPGGRKKIVPKNIKELLTPRAVAYWFMDDGTYHQDQKSNVRSFLFSTQGFTKSENDLLALCLTDKYGIKCSVHKDKTYYRLYVHRESTETLLNLIRPHIHENYFYKIDIKKKT